MGKAVAYLRVSTKGQDRSGLSLTDQSNAIKYYCETQKIQLVRIFKEQASGRNNERKIVHKAMEFCNEQNAELFVSKQNRLARSTLFIATLIYCKFKFKSVNNPHATKLQILLQAVIDENEADEIANNTKRSLAVAVKNGVKMGGNPAKRRRTLKKKKRAYLRKIRPTINREYTKYNKIQSLTDRLNRMRFTKLNGKRGNWSLSETHGILRDLKIIK